MQSGLDFIMSEKQGDHFVFVPPLEQHLPFEGHHLVLPGPQKYAHDLK